MMSTRRELFREFFQGCSQGLSLFAIVMFPGYGRLMRAHRSAVVSQDVGKVEVTGIALNGGTATVTLAGGTNGTVTCTIVLPNGPGIFVDHGVYDMRFIQE